MSRLPVPDLGAYLREQREAAQLSLRQLSEIAGVSNPYLSQIERGLRRPSAEILNALAKALQVSAESLYVRAGFLEGEPDAAPGPGRPDAPATTHRPGTPGVVEAVEADPALTPQQRRALVDLYHQLAADTRDPDPAPPPRRALTRTAPTPSRSQA